MPVSNREEVLQLLVIAKGAWETELALRALAGGPWQFAILFDVSEARQLLRKHHVDGALVASNDLTWVAAVVGRLRLWSRTLPLAALVDAGREIHLFTTGAHHGPARKARNPAVGRKPLPATIAFV